MKQKHITGGTETEMKGQSSMKNHWLARRFTTVAAVAFLVFGMLAAAGTQVSATPAAGGGGDNGDIKVRSGGWTATEGDRNEPQLCSPFHLSGFNFDPTSGGSWGIDIIPPTSNPPTLNTLTGSWGTTPDGQWHTDLLVLGDGHYKLHWQQGANNEKHKTFWIACNVVPNPDTATIRISPLTATNNVGAQHVFTITVTGTATLTDVNIDPSVSPAPSSQSDSCATPSVSGTTATCTLTINSSTVAGPFTASASATGTTGTTPFGVATDGTGGNSTAATKNYACLTHNLTLTLTRAGMTDFSYGKFGDGTWTVTFFYSTDGGANWASSTTTSANFHGTAAGDPTNYISKTIAISTPTSPYTATVDWYFTINPGLFTSIPFLNGSPDLTQVHGLTSLFNTGDCSAADNAQSPFSNPTIYKVLDSVGDGNVCNPADFTCPDPTNVLDTRRTELPGAGWWIVATSGAATVAGQTDAFGSVVLNLDGFLTWNICETGKGATAAAATMDGYVRTVGGPATGGCYTLNAGTEFSTAPFFANYKTVDLTVSKTATPTFTRTFDWTTAKTVDHALVDSATNATFTYTVTATKGTGVDSAWAISGTITVTNTNPIAVDVTLGDGTCTLAHAALTVPANGTATSDYNCGFSSGASGTNTASATWATTGAMAGTTGSASGTANYAFVTPTTLVDDSATITDSFAGTLGTTSATHVYTYTRTITATANACTQYGNTATTTEGTTSQTTTASQSVTICGRTTGGLTIGYWSNKNGQAQITGAGSVPSTNICVLTSTLRAYAPFQDLSATASCATVNAYVQTVIKAANASGASMNAMLKAQMLATVLSVNFTPSLGTKNIDLTYINKPIGSTTFENTSSSFNGATSSTVNALLTYAASRSNLGGTQWYGQVKNGSNSQELAKDTFDAINNNVTFVAP